MFKEGEVFMQGLLKINLKGGLKRLISTLIYLMMVSATFPMHMFQGSVWATDSDITIELKSDKIGSVATWMSETEGPLSKTALVADDAPDEIVINVTEDINVNSSYTVDNVPTMTTGSDGNKYLFDFTDKRFKDKTITIDGTKSGGRSTITIDNAALFFLNMQNCKVILKNIVIDGRSDSAIERAGAFINVGLASELETRSSTIQDCCNSEQSGYGGAINNAGNLKFLQNSKISNCTCEGENGCGGAVYNTGILIMDEKCEINDCACVKSGGAIYNLNQLIIAGESSINGHINISEGQNASVGGAIYNDSVGVVTIDSGKIENCFANDFGGAIYNNSTGALTINKCYITGCHVTFSEEETERADAIYNKGVLMLPYTQLELLTIVLPEEHASCDHNSTANEVYGYKGIYNDDGIVRANPNYNIQFVEAGTSEKLGQGMFTKYSDVCVPERAGYRLISLNDEGENSIDVADNKFKLDGDIIQNAKQDGVITLTATYKKIYTIQYIYDNKVVATKKDCIRDQTLISAIMDANWNNIAVDDNKKLNEIATPKLGYTFSEITYGDALKYVASGDTATIWDSLSQAAVGDVISIFLNHEPRKYNIMYMDEDGTTSINVTDAGGSQIQTQEVKFGEDIKAVTPFKKLGYDFKCWHVLGSDGNELKDNGDPIDFETAKASWETLANAADDNNTIKLKAVYAPKTYTIKYNPYSTDVVDPTTYTISQDKNLNSYVEVSSTKPSKLGYEFKKWVYTQPDGSDADVNGVTWDTLIKSAMVDSAGNNVIVLRATYEKIEPQEAKKSSPKNPSYVNGIAYESGSVITNQSFFGNA